jgi:hypothetical protein
MREIDQHHDYYAVKRLQNKPVTEFTDHCYLLVAEAEKQGYISGV